MALSSCSLYVANGLAASVLQSRPNSVILEPVLPEAGIRPQDYIIRSRGSGVVLAASKTSRVVVGGSWKMFLDAFVDDKRLSNGQLFHNIVGWLLR